MKRLPCRNNSRYRFCSNSCKVQLLYVTHKGMYIYKPTCQKQAVDSSASYSSQSCSAQDSDQGIAFVGHKRDNAVSLVFHARGVT